MEINTILNSVLSELKKLNFAENIILFGSAVSSKNFADIDLLLYIKKDFFSPKKLLKLLKCMDKLENKYPKYLALSYSSGEVRGNKKLVQISICPDHKYSKDEILEYSICLNNKVLFGENPYKNYVKPEGQYFLSILNRHHMSQKINYKILKQYLFLGLLYLGIYENKENLLERFDFEYSTNIFNSEKDIYKFLQLENKILFKKFDEIYKIIYDKIIINEPECINKKVRKSSPIENFFFEIHKKLMSMWKNNSFIEIENFLKKMQLEFKNKFPNLEKIV